jgi:hypothetical protein
MKDILKAVKSGRITKRKPAKKLRLSTYLSHNSLSDLDREERDKLQVLAGIHSGEEIITS